MKQKLAASPALRRYISLALIALVPLLVITAFNVLFSLQIQYGIDTYIAALFLWLMLKPVNNNRTVVMMAPPAIMPTVFPFAKHEGSTSAEVQSGSNKVH